MTRPSVTWLSAGEHDVPADDGWLTDRESAWMGRMRYPKRRSEFRLARWCAKNAITFGIDPAPQLHRVEIGHLPEGAPAGYVDGIELERRISMTDRAGWAVCSVAPAGIEVGVDLELVEPRSRAFVDDYFTSCERSLAIDGEAVDPVLANLVWSAKESALKVLRTGLRRDTRSVEVDLGSAPDGGWAPLHVAGTGIEVAFEGWWRRFGPFLLTVVADAPTGQPVSLQAVPALADAEPVHSWLEAPGPVDAG